MTFPSVRRLRNLALALTLIAVPAMHAQTASTSETTVVNVPFAFEVGSTHFKAGQYTFSAPRAGILEVHGNSNAMTTTSKATETKPREKSVLLFHKAGGKYFLAGGPHCGQRGLHPMRQDHRGDLGA